MQTKGQLMKSLNTAFSFAPPSILSLTIQKSKYFNLAEMFKSKTLPKTDEIASILDGKTWEEFH